MKKARIFLAAAVCSLGLAGLIRNFSIHPRTETHASSEGRVPAASDEDLSICGPLRQYFTKGLATQGRIQEVMSAHEGIANAQVLFIGEEHTDPVSKDKVSELIRPYLLEKGTCLALEVPVNFQSFMNRIEPGDAPEALAKKLAEKVVALKQDSLPWEAQRAEIQTAIGSYLPWMKMALDARKGGNAVLAIDMPPTRIEYPSSSDPAEKDKIFSRNNNHRNHEMAKALAKRITSGECRKIVSVNGMFHLFANRDDGSIRSIPQLLTDAGMSHHTLFASSGVTYFMPLPAQCEFGNDFNSLSGDYIFTGAEPALHAFKPTLKTRTGRPAYRPFAADEHNSFLAFVFSGPQK